jgi:cytochrome c peroxidase
MDWPANVEQVCNTPGPPPANDPAPVHLSATDRGRAATTFDQMAQSITGYEASHEVTAFSSKYDAVLAGKAQFTPQEKQGYELFRGKGRCNDCHRDGGPGEDPLFTDFTATNIGTPANPDLPYYSENVPDARGYTANKDGASFVDGGVGAFLSGASALRRRCALENAGIRQPGTIPGPDLAQCR